MRLTFFWKILKLAMYVPITKISTYNFYFFRRNHWKFKAWARESEILICEIGITSICALRARREYSYRLFCKEESKVFCRSKVHNWAEWIRTRWLYLCSPHALSPLDSRISRLARKARGNRHHHLHSITSHSPTLTRVFSLAQRSLHRLRFPPFAFRALYIRRVHPRGV